ncbi:MAG: glycosyltransferase family 4 protein [Leptolyngbya sp. BL-A-14]
MIIGHFDSHIWAKGGLATYIRRISAAQQAAGHTVYYFTRQPCTGNSDREQPIVVATDAELFEQAEQLGLDILHLHRAIATVPPPHIPTIRTLHGHAPYCPSASKFLGRWNQPCNRPYSLHGCLWGHFVDRCGSVRPQNLFDSWHEFQQERSVLPNIPVVTVSHFLKDCMVRSGYPASSIHVLHLFAPDQSCEVSPPEEGTPRFVFLGRISPQKGLEWLLHALQQVSVPIQLDVAGEGDQEVEMRQLTQQLGLSDRVTFHGWVSPDQVSHLIRSARALIFPSIWHEPGGTVAFESMANSRAVIMSQVGGMPEVVMDGLNGLLVEPNNVNELAASIERLATDWSLATQLGVMGRKMATEQFTLQNHFNQLMQLYQQAMEPRLVNLLEYSS